MVLAFAVIIGEIFEQFGLPSVAGELLSGIILGPTVLGIIQPNDQIQALSSIALFFIIFHIGVELETQSLRAHVHKAALISVTSLIVPLVLALVISLATLPFGYAADFVFALAIAVPSISIISVLVMQYRILEQESGRIILASTVIADVVAFILLAGISLSVQSTLSVIIYTLVFTACFIAVDYLLNSRPEVVQKSLRRIGRLLKREDISYAMLIVLGLIVAFFFELIGISYIIGAFFAGLIIHDGLVGKKTFKTISTTLTRMNRAFFIPIFFGFAGTEAFLSQGSLALVVIALPGIILISIPPSILLTYQAAKRILKVEHKGAKQISVITGGRGAVGIVVASVALSRGLINSTAFSLIILGTLAISLAVPTILRERKENGGALS